jgi:hypothetical protein
MTAHPRQRTRSAPAADPIAADLPASAPKRRFIGLALAGLALLGLQVLYAFHWRVNSDEPQHLHVVWAWTRGLLPYRDVFDNHTPLFQMLSAPLLWMLGERADIVVWMRLGELPFWALALWCTFRIGRTLFSARAGLLAVAATALYPTFVTLGIEFRPDLAWAALWLLAITIAIEGRLTRRRAFFAGLVAGCAISVSMKSILLIGCFGFALLLVSVLRARADARIPLRKIASKVFAAIAGFVLVPLALAAFFAAHGAWQDMLYGVFRHNMVPGLGLRRAPWHVWILPAMLPLLGWLAARLLRGAPQAWIGARRALVLLSALVYAIAVIGYWPLPTQQDVLPFIPLLMVFIAGAVTDMAQRGRPNGSQALAWTLVGAELVLLLTAQPPWNDNASAYTRTEATMLALTSPADPVMDCKGEAISRTRPTRLVLEAITRRRMQMGWLADDIPEHLRDTQVVIRDCGDLPPRTTAFLNHNYLAIGNQVAVAGRRFPAVPAATPVTFSLGVAGRYSVVADHDDFQGSIDGAAYAGPRMLATGRHTLASARAETGVALIWSRALARGFHATSQAIVPLPVAAQTPRLTVERHARAGEPHLNGVIGI